MATTERTSLLQAPQADAAQESSRRTWLALRLVGVLAVVAGCVLLAMGLAAAADKDSNTNGASVDERQYDAIVIGGGPAGSVMSKALADDRWRRVLLIEAGDASQTELGGQSAVDSEWNIRGLTPFDIPYLWTNVTDTQSFHWDYPDVHVAKALGGCGIHNAMLYVRALPSDFERWNMPNWSWAKALQIYMDIEDYNGPSSVVHGTDGFVRTSPPSIQDELSEQFLQACEDVGLPRTPDFNAPSGRHGAGYYNFNTRDGVRESAARTFLGPMIKDKRDNFHLLLNTRVERILIDHDNETTGVEIVHANGSRDAISLSKGGKVVLTAGAINTPRVLMMSGIGDRGQLERMNVTVKKHLTRVGMNLQDHPVLGVTFQPVQPDLFDIKTELETYFRASQDPHANASSYGIMGSTGISAGAFLIPPGSTMPEIQLTFFPRMIEPHLVNHTRLNTSDALLITVALLTPRARNRIVLMRKNATDDDTQEGDWVPRVMSEVPEAEPEHLRGDDVWKLSWGIRVVRQIAAKMIEKGLIGPEVTPGSAISSEKDLNTWVYGAVVRNSHWVGSAAMAQKEADGVVDNHLRVFGIKNLLIADASVIPKIPNGNVHSTVVLTAFHGAELIKLDEQEEKLT